MNILELVGLRKEFGKLVAVDDVDLSVEEGEIRGLIGPNGSGKSTLFNLVTGCIRSTRGKVIWQGRNITGQQPHTIVEKGIARTFQANVLLNERTALQNVIMACHLRSKMGYFKQIFGTPMGCDEEKKAMGLLDIMGVAHVKDEIAGELPHGYQRCLAIAISLASEPKLLLLDEPVTGMDPTEKRQVIDRVKEIRDSGVTIILVEHDMKSVMATCEMVTVLNFGKKTAEGAPEEIRKHKDVIEAYLGEGYIYA